MFSSRFPGEILAGDSFTVLSLGAQTNNNTPGIRKTKQKKEEMGREKWKGGEGREGEKRGRKTKKPKTEFHHLVTYKVTNFVGRMN